MRDRLSTFADPKIIKLINENFIPVAANDWFQRRRKDAVGEFFIKVADQGPRKGEGGSTRQGHYTFTAGGKLLVYNNNRGADKRTEMLQDSLAKWRALPESERAAGAVKVEALNEAQLDKQFAQLLPKGTVVLKTSTRLLKPAGESFAAISKSENTNDWGHLAAHNQMWLQAEEIAALRKLNGETPVDLPSSIAYRLMRFHFIDNSRGEPDLWTRDHIGAHKITIHTSKGMPERRVISGQFSIKAGDARGFEGNVLGYFDIDSKSDTLSDAKVVVIGDHWGGGTFTGGARPGKSPLGIAFSLADMKNDPAAKVPPQGTGWLKGYWEADRY